MRITVSTCNNVTKWSYILSFTFEDNVLSRKNSPKLFCLAIQVELPYVGWLQDLQKIPKKSPIQIMQEFFVLIFLLSKNKGLKQTSWFGWFKKDIPIDNLSQFYKISLLKTKILLSCLKLEIKLNLPMLFYYQLLPKIN